MFWKSGIEIWCNLKALIGGQSVRGREQKKGDRTIEVGRGNAQVRKRQSPLDRETYVSYTIRLISLSHSINHSTLSSYLTTSKAVQTEKTLCPVPCTFSLYLTPFP